MRSLPLKSAVLISKWPVWTAIRQIALLLCKIVWLQAAHVNLIAIHQRGLKDKLHS
jgi:hypothetical protein